MMRKRNIGIIFENAKNRMRFSFMRWHSCVGIHAAQKKREAEKSASRVNINQERNGSVLFGQLLNC
jgi:hypothetical protein